MTEVDKSTWGPGPWQSEPDFLEWDDLETGLSCRIRRNGSGSLCGYVGVPKSYSTYEQKYDDLNHVYCHRGLTFSNWMEDAPGSWWFGFDCAHSGDYCPADVRGRRSVSLQGSAESYKDIEYVRSEVTSLAEQLFNPLEALAATCAPEE